MRAGTQDSRCSLAARSSRCHFGRHWLFFYRASFFSLSRLIHIIDWQQHGARLDGWPQGKWEGRMHGRLETTDTPLVFTRLPPSPCCF
ncbi:uncharacterized protein CCOS01_13844 [Colletotrichum costaricense]|uniref:Uncharacterized protein n=1 Tax=Colletotrichum costaricense TaxID=1209916 RepID=A0AAJ0DUZ7_9PEZI|nr:uncharacterized protein CCOS01_13844 [Colletotrichum costaricense]KAK1514563.1 hypothetical protein CCOS01_13844 [Colletotrichum costaricense]